MVDVEELEGELGLLWFLVLDYVPILCILASMCGVGGK